MEEACRAVPCATAPPDEMDYSDYIENLMLTPLDLRLDNVIVNNAILHYRREREDEIQTLDDLREVLAGFAHDAEGNREAARHVWGYSYGQRLRALRGLAEWANDMGLTDQEHLRAWAHSSDYSRDFAGRVKGLGFAAYCWLIMRLGVDTVKPDQWLHAFVMKTLGHDLGDAELVAVMTEAAHRVGRRARELDGAIWEHMRGAPGSI
jgi:hypothetical protein